MKFTPRHLEDNVNVSKTHPLVELAWLTGGLIFLCTLLFFGLSLATDLSVNRISPRLEIWLGEHLQGEFPGQNSQPLTELVANLVQTLPPDSPLHQYQFEVVVSDNKEVNAIALPGGTIVVFSGLLQQIESENELSMVLGHELGHFAHRDHLRSLGRGLSLTLAAVLLFGTDNGASDLMAKTLLTLQSRYSQAQEQKADSFGLEILQRYYGHCSGATTLFQQLARKGEAKLPYLLASHPHPQARIDALNSQIKQRHCSLDKLQPRPQWLP